MKPGEQQAAQPWYRQFWPWFVFGLPATVVIACMITIYIAVSNPDSLVKDNYYREGLAVNRDLAAQQAASALGVRAVLHANSSTTDVSVKLRGEFTSPPQQLMLLFIHPNDAQRDMVVPLYAVDAEQYIGELPAAVTGRWHLQLSPADTREWQVKKTVQADAQFSTELSGQ